MPPEFFTSVAHGGSPVHGSTLHVSAIGTDVAEVRFECRGAAVSKLDRLTIDELRVAIDTIRANPKIQGVLVTNAHDSFIVGADIHELTALFSQPQDQGAAGIAATSAVFTALEGLALPQGQCDKRSSAGRPAGGRSGHRLSRHVRCRADRLG